jgi:hypothetical protein
LARYADSVYSIYEIEGLPLECERVSLLTQREGNSRREDSPAMGFIKTAMRKRIETTFSGITEAFPRYIHAVTPEGFLLKIVLFIFAYTVNRCI